MPHKSGAGALDTVERITLTVGEVATLLGVPQPTIYHWLTHNEFPNDIWFKIGKRILFVEKELMQFIRDKAGRVPSDKARNQANSIYNTVVGPSSASRRKRKEG